MIGAAAAGFQSRHLAIPKIDVLDGLLFHYVNSVLPSAGVVMVTGIARPIAAAAAEPFVSRSLVSVVLPYDP